MWMLIFLISMECLVVGRPLPSLVWLPAIEAALERTDSDQKMALLCSAIPHTAPLLRIQLCTHFPVETELGSMCYTPVVGRPLYHPWFLACETHVKHVKVLNKDKFRFSRWLKRQGCLTQFSGAFGIPDLLVVVFVSILVLTEYTLDFINILDRQTFYKVPVLLVGVWQQGVQGDWHYVGGKWRGHEKCRKGHTCWEGGGGGVLWGLWGSFVGASTGNISERLKSVDILERFKAVIFQSGGSLCDAGWPAAPYRRYCTQPSFSSSWIRKDCPSSRLVFFSPTYFGMIPREAGNEYQSWFDQDRLRISRYPLGKQSNWAKIISRMCENIASWKDKCVW